MKMLLSSLFGFVFNFNLIILLSLSLATSNHFYQKSYAHDFLINNDTTLGHARNAAELLKDLEDNMTEASEQSSSNLIQIYENEKTNTTSLALVTANIVDEVLRKYGTAFDIGYDLTNMSNMGGMKMSNMSSGGGSSMNMTTFQTSANNNTLERYSNMSMPTMAGNNLEIVSIQDYETSQVLADVVNELFEDDLRPRTSVSETINIDKLEKNLNQLDQAILNKASPEALMGIVHVQIHPTLQQVYKLELELSGNVIAEDSD